MFDELLLSIVNLWGGRQANVYTIHQVLFVGFTKGAYVQFDP
jgi:hypothetical protein